MTNFTAKRGSRILVIEDDPVLNEQLMSLLRDQGYHVDQCFDGEEGLTEAASSNHDLILLDVMLPGRDGLSLLNILRNSCDTPVIIVSA
ncbi:MAG: response regulator, partial [Pseudomonadota bacterium]